MSDFFLSICKQNNIPLDSSNKFIIPDNIKRVKLDIGLSYNAPFATRWLDRESDLLVFGFEPHPETFTFLKKKTYAIHPIQKAYEPPIPYIDTRLFIFPVAVSDSGNKLLDFFAMNVDVGVSSLFKPSNFFFEKNPEYSIQSVVKVPVITLKDFFDCFPFDKIPYIEYIKIDAQGSDLNIIKGAGDYLQNNVVYITLEADGCYYENAENCNTNEIIQEMEKIGFLMLNHPNTSDPTFVNSRFINIAHTIFIQQKI